VFKEILKIIPRLDQGDLNKMERSLTQRFGRIAKKFGKGLVGVLTGGGIAGLAIGLIDKLLNPLKEVQESIDRIFKQGDDLVTYANQFGTTAGKLAKLEGFAQSTGLDRESLFYVLQRFQTAVAEATIDPNKPTAVRQFAGRTDTADAFFEFIQNLQKLDKGSQALVQQEVFGERQILKMADFLQSDFQALNKFFANINSDDLTRAAEKAGGLSDLTDALSAQRNLQDLIAKSRVINEGIVRDQDARARVDLQRENERIKSYHSLSVISEASTKILTLVEKGFLALTDLVTKVTGLTEIVKKLAPSRIWRGIFGGSGD